MKKIIKERCYFSKKADENILYIINEEGIFFKPETCELNKWACIIRKKDLKDNVDIFKIPSKDIYREIEWLFTWVGWKACLSGNTVSLDDDNNIIQYSYQNLLFYDKN